MQAAAEVDAVGGLTGPDGLAHGPSALDDARAHLVHPCERRHVVGADAQVLVGVLGVVRSRLHRIDEVGLVHRLQPGVVDDVRSQHLDVAVGEDAELLTEPSGQGQADRLHGVRGPEVVLREIRVPDDPGLARHKDDATPSPLRSRRRPTQTSHGHRCRAAERDPVCRSSRWSRAHADPSDRSTAVQPQRQGHGDLLLVSVANATHRTAVVGGPEAQARREGDRSAVRRAHPIDDV